MSMKRYNPNDIEPKWQRIWEEKKAFNVAIDTQRQKTYASGMFPYPSGAGMHTGHAFSWAIVDAISRFQRAHGHNVLNPMGWDTFGLPAENYAIKTGTSPATATAKNIANFKTQFRRMGVSIDWSREVNTSNPDYYRWTQWIFTKLFGRGLAYQKESLQWWCPVDKTVLANEQVEGGQCWRCGSVVEKKSMTQWFFKITEYADALLEEIPDLDWPEKIKTAQTNWIGRSQGAEIQFATDADDQHVTVFTTRPDTMYGATFVVLAPEHPLVQQLTSEEQRESVEAYVHEAVKKSEIDRLNDTKEKTGVFIGAYAINPATEEKIPIWVADYVLFGYGTGAIMAVPAHDDRDKEFAEKFNLPIKTVIQDDIMVNSGEFDGRNINEVREAIVSWLEQKGVGKSKVTYKMRDWLISRQRYWGAPIPMVHCPDHGAVAVPDNQLPVVLPEVEDYAPRGDGKSVLARDEEWVNTTCPTCGKPSRRETDTMDGYACSSWYLLRFADPHNDLRAWDPELANYWAPVDFYVGGDHAVAHLLYVRFWTHVFNDMGLTSFKEPVKKLVYHGYINAEDGTKMSKSKGNVVDPLDVINQGYGADSLRTYLLFMGPIELDASWNSRSIAGVYRFLNRAWTLVQEYIDSDKSFTGHDDLVLRARHKMVRKVYDDFRRLSFNTAISALMEYVNELYKYKVDGFSDATWREALEVLVQCIAPFAPHMAEELWSQLGHEGFVHEAHWPGWNNELITDDTVTVVVQVNGKLRAQIELPKDCQEADVQSAALANENVAKFVGGQEPLKVVYVPGKLINIVVR